MDPDDRCRARSVKLYGKENFVPGSGYFYNECNPNNNSNDVVDLV